MANDGVSREGHQQEREVWAERTVSRRLRNQRDDEIGCGCSGTAQDDS